MCISQVGTGFLGCEWMVPLLLCPFNEAIPKYVKCWLEFLYVEENRVYTFYSCKESTYVGGRVAQQHRYTSPNCISAGSFHHKNN